MDRRTGDTPMDFEYDNGGGQRSANSPFPKGDPNKRGFGGSNNSSGFQGSSIFGTTPSARPLPQTPQKTHLYRDNPNFDFSSGAENQSSPDNADNEDTPENPKVGNLISKNVTVFRGRSPSKPTPSRRDSISNFFGRLGRQRNEAPRPFQSGALERRVHKRKRRDVEKENQLYRRGSQDSDWGSRPSSSEGAAAKDPEALVKEMGTIPAILSFIHSHPNLPTVLARYAHTIVVYSLAFFFLCIAWTFWKAIQNEVNIEAEAAADVIRAGIEKCTSEYLSNRCGSDAETPPALREKCAGWRGCMNQDPLAIGRASVGAGAFSKVLNSFVEPLSYKLIVVFLATVAVAAWVPGALFGTLMKESPPPHMPYQHMGNSFPPTPYVPSPYPQQGIQEAFFTPQNQRHGERLERHESPSRRGRESPSKAIGYR